MDNMTLSGDDNLSPQTAKPKPGRAVVSIKTADNPCMNFEEVHQIAGLYKSSCESESANFEDGNKVRVGLAYIIPIPRNGKIEIEVFAVRVAEGQSKESLQRAKAFKTWSGTGNICIAGKELHMQYRSEDANGTVIHDQFQLVLSELGSLVTGKFSHKEKNNGQEVIGIAKYEKLNDDNEVIAFLNQFNVKWEELNLQVSGDDVVELGGFLASKEQLKPEGDRSRFVIDILTGNAFTTSSKELYGEISKNCQNYTSIVYLDFLPTSN